MKKSSLAAAMVLLAACGNGGPEPTPEPKPDNSGYYTFGFTWQLTDGRLTVTGSAERPVFYDINFSIYPFAQEVVWTETPRAIEQMVWKVDQSSADGMVLAYLPHPVELQITGTGIKAAETHTWRYTFEMIE